MSKWIPSETIKTGEHAEHPAYEDDRYVKCWNCGFICHLERDKRGGRGDGRVIVGPTYDSSNITYDDLITYDQGLDETKIEQGCPLCGALNYNQEIYG